MKEDDKVILAVEKERYAREGAHEGMQGYICDPRKIDGYWLVAFWVDDDQGFSAIVEVKEEDLELIWEAPEYKVGTTVLLFANDEKRLAQGIKKGMFGVICGECEDKEYWQVKFMFDDGTEKTTTVYFNDMSPLRDDEVEEYKERIAKELKQRENESRNSLN